MDTSERWSPLPWNEWKDTCETLHLWTQIVGKAKLQLAPFLNELWEVGFHVTARGMTTGIIPTGERVFEVNFDFVDHNLFVATSDGQIKAVPLTPRSVADFYDEFMSILQALGIDVTITTTPVETSITTPYDRDHTHASYDAGSVNRWWRILVQTTTILQRYRSSFSGKSSPVLFYWGSFDLSEARYSGKPLPPSEGMPRFYQIAEDEENVACGFWPGNPNASGVTLGEPAFYSYIKPAPEGYKDASVQPSAAQYDSRLGEFILRYQDARSAASPDQTILDFFQSTYRAAAELAHWDRASLERNPAQVP
ncbi:MAG: DUF5996 family protein [Chloroflexota bacterium]|nr:DUF5996 family protein [Chloroflexota bacterium]